MGETEILMIIKGIGETLYMTLVASTLGYVIGLPWGIALCISGKDGLHPNKIIYGILNFITNIMRSIPFLILLILVLPLTLLIVKKTYGSTAVIVPLVISASPLIARMVESSLNEVDRGVIEAAQAIGADTLSIIRKVLIGESRISLISGATITVGTILGYSAMAGTIGGGGLGNIAIQYGYYRYKADILWVTVIILVLLVQIFQFIGNLIALKLDRRHS